MFICLLYMILYCISDLNSDLGPKNRISVQVYKELFIKFITGLGSSHDLVKLESSGTVSGNSRSARLIFGSTQPAQRLETEPRQH